MDNLDVAEQRTSTTFILISGFMGEILSKYNRLNGRKEGSPVGKDVLLAWLDKRADEVDGGDGLSVLESEILRNRDDVRDIVLENGTINVCRLRLWAITHGAHELSLDEEILADTIEHALSLRARDS